MHLPGCPHLCVPVFASVSLSLQLRLSMSVDHRDSICLCLPASASESPSLSQYPHLSCKLCPLNFSSCFHLSKLKVCLSLLPPHLSLPVLVQPDPHPQLGPSSTASCVCPSPRRWREGTPMTSPAPLRPPPPSFFNFSNFSFRALLRARRREPC